MRWSRTKLDRYPAKMTGALASRLVALYGKGATNVLDPFCGSGAILLAAKSQGLITFGVDINPYAILLARVKIEGFKGDISATMASEIISDAAAMDDRLPMDDGHSARYWFSDNSIEGIERIRFQLLRRSAGDTPEGRALLLALALAARPCSYADQRSPKPFISKRARIERRDEYTNPIREFTLIYEQLRRLYGVRRGSASGRILHADMADPEVAGLIPQHTHVITSPPYINAQDYFRSSRLELLAVSHLLPLDERGIEGRFIGTERRLQARADLEAHFQWFNELIPGLDSLNRHPRRLDLVVLQYFTRMAKAVENIRDCLAEGGTFVLVCGDNLVGGVRIETWHVLSVLAERAGFNLVDRFGDSIACRSLPPKRMGHKGLIKNETVSVFRRGVQH